MKFFSVLVAILGVAIFALTSVNQSSANDMDDLTGGEWVLVSYDGIPVSDESIITLEFNIDGTIVGDGGCNSYGGNYVVDGESISFGSVFSTRRFCDGLMEQESAYFAALEATTNYTLTDNALVISYGDNGQELVFERKITLVGSRWQLVSFGDEPTVTDSIVTLNFGEDARVFGSAGCNNYGGPYTFNNNDITFGMLISTMMACQEDITAQEIAFFAALDAATSYEISQDTLIIYYDDSEQMVFENAIKLIGTQWILTVFDGADPLADTTITLEFDEEGRAFGSSGCNSYGGSFTVEDDTLAFGMMTSTMMACLQDNIMQQEQAYLQALNATVRYEIFGNRLIIVYGDGQRLTFEPASTE